MDVSLEITRVVMAIAVANTGDDITLVDELIEQAIEEHGAFTLVTGMLGFFTPFLDAFAMSSGVPLQEMLQKLGTRLAVDDDD